jgi:hypothetical protein
MNHNGINPLWVVGIIIVESKTSRIEIGKTLSS